MRRHHPLELNQPADVIAEVHHPDLEPRPPALAALCRRFAGFGMGRIVSEQAAALQGLAMIGGREAAHAVSRMIERAVVQGPVLKVAVSAAAQLRATLSVDVLPSLLRLAEGESGRGLSFRHYVLWPSKYLRGTPPSAIVG